MFGEPVARHVILAIFPLGEDRRSLDGILGQPNWQLQFTSSFLEAQTALLTFRVAVVLSGSRLSDGHSWKDVLELLNCTPSPPPLIVADRLADEALWAEVLNLGGYDLLATPFDAKEVVHAVATAVRFRENELERSAVARKPPAPATVSGRNERAAVAGRSS